MKEMALTVAHMNKVVGALGLRLHATPAGVKSTG